MKSELSRKSKDLRLDIIKLSKANGGYHYGGSFSCAEILLVLYEKILSDNDRFILSKGHACWGYYVMLRRKGLNPLLEGHPHLDLTNGVHWTTGSEGHGLPAGLGMSKARKILNKDGKIYVLMGDGECQEGTTWESFLLANQFKLNNLVVIVDNNKIQGSGFVDEILSVASVGNVAKEVGWEVARIDGHDEKSIEHELKKNQKKPKIIIADTVKGKGVSYMENQPKWHANWPSPEFEKQAIEELSK